MTFILRFIVSIPYIVVWHAGIRAVLMTYIPYLLLGVVFTIIHLVVFIFTSVIGSLQSGSLDFTWANQVSERFAAFDTFWNGFLFIPGWFNLMTSNDPLFIFIFVYPFGLVFSMIYTFWAHDWIVDTYF